MFCCHLVEYKQGIQGLQALAFCVRTVNNEPANLDSKESLGVKFKDGICTALYLKRWFKSDWSGKLSAGLEVTDHENFLKEVCIIYRNHTNTFLLINQPAKNNSCQRKLIAARAICSDIAMSH